MDNVDCTRAEDSIKKEKEKEAKEDEEEEENETTRKSKTGKNKQKQTTTPFEPTQEIEQIQTNFDTEIDSEMKLVKGK